MIIKQRNIFIYVLCILFFSACQKCVDIEIPYQEQESYIEIEEHDIVLGYLVDDSEWERISGIPFLDIQPYISSYVEVENTSDYTGKYIVEQIYLNTYGEKKRTQKTQYIEAGKTVFIQFEYYLDYYEYLESVTYDITAPTKTIVNEVTKYRTVTKYRQCNTCEEDCGPVYRNSIPWWVFGIIGGVLLSILLGVIVKKV